MDPSKETSPTTYSHNAGTHCEPSERQRTGPSSVLSKIQSHMNDSVRPSSYAELELLLLTFCTGIQDAVSFPDYHCFASNQTGNTVFLMLAIVMPSFDGEMFITANIGTALGFFLAAGWLTGQLSHMVGARQRWWLVLCNFFQACLVFAAAAIQQVYGTELRGSAAITAIALLAFASGSQVVQSRSLAMTEISTAMATAAWVDLMMDPHMFRVRGNRPRDRRVSFLLTLILGCLAGAGIYKTAGSAVAIFVSAAGKMLVTIMYLFNGAERPKEDDAESGSL
ncbi:hypothetical protein PG993_001982 [Apiospora rasikravindrae]|uniref:DUF1275 domain protein n=1 Tax=Apiospora rasikravindrae TaxID=990691 RepID=A0ABR1UCX3_9PEZI